MPIISSFTYCEDAKQEITPQGPKLMVLNPFASILPAFIPGGFSFSVVIGIGGIVPTEEQLLRYIFRHEEENSEILIDTGDVRFTMGVDESLKLVPAEYQGVALSMDFKNLVFRKKGKYISFIYLNNQLVAEYPIMVHGREQ
ncbi:hypothetical protein [Paenibacillus sp. PDC88]|uniref:DUF6941 family protein n=1 Tax=Paenibacillus sp. PDC88 TaxID=1884375 RepID=UPI000899586F|nr:hypothetical protein [Paenibacillus sp. PDC88]SDW30169.1 hypothetical protein SAMN05518848_101934 [Paenibacillus sp. PDC88]